MAQIIFTIPDVKIAEFKAGFIKRCPVPVDEDTGVPECTENEWIKEAGKQWYIRMYREGKKAIAREATAPIIDDDIVT